MTDTTNRNSTPSTPLRRIGRFALVAACFIVLYLIIRPLVPLFSESTNVQITEKSNPSSFAEMRLNLSESEQENKLNLSIEQITVLDSKTGYDEYASVCLQEINIYADLFQPAFSRITKPFTDVETEQVKKPYSLAWLSSDYQRIPHQLEDLCVIPSDSTVINISFSPTRTNIIEITNPGTLVVSSPEIIPSISQLEFEEERSVFYYPFDKRSAFLGLSALAQATNTVEDKKTTRLAPLAPHLSLNIDFPNWSSDIEIQSKHLSPSGSEQPYAFFNRNDNWEIFNIQREPATVVSISQQRPLAQQFLTGILIFSILIFILSLLFIQETGTFLEVAVGILLGLWGVQDILIPDYITGPTLINTLILAFYVLLAFVAAIRFAVRPLWHRLGPPSPAPSPDPEPPTPPPTPEPPVPAPVVIQPQMGGVLQWVTAVSATITAIATLLHLSNRRKNH